MNDQQDDTARIEKERLRADSHRVRNAQRDSDGLSRVICAKFSDQDAFTTAGSLLFYVSVRSEVQTRELLQQTLSCRQRVLVPFCADGGNLSIFHLEAMAELALGGFGLLEPKPELRGQASKVIDMKEVDLVMVPGLAFDRRGGRLGHGKGYYDRLLSQARADTLLVGVAFECQMQSSIPMLPHDVFLDRVITENNTYKCR